VGEGTIMRLKAGAFSRYRPRILTLIVLAIVAAPIVVANLCHDEVTPQVSPLPNPSYGWPLIWYECKFTRASVGGASPARMDPELVQLSESRLAGNVAIWCLMLAVAGVFCEWLLRRYRPQIRFRPRLVTLIVLIAVAAPIVLANLSEGEWPRGWSLGVSRFFLYGWPLIWRWRNCSVGYGSMVVLDWNFSAARLAVNLTTWLVMLTAVGIACEWLLRRYRPRLRWSLRTMLTAVGLLAVLCAWCTALRDRANVYDSLIAEIHKQNGRVCLGRWGPKWLDVVGADRFRRRIIGASLQTYNDNFDGEELLRRLGKLPDLRYLELSGFVDLWTSGMVAALGDMGQLRILRIESYQQSAVGISDEELAAIGKLNQLEVLDLQDTRVTNDGLRHLAGLTNLKSLRLVNDYRDFYYGDDYYGKSRLEHLASSGELLVPAHLPVLPRLEAICFKFGLVRDRDVRQLAAFPRLKSLDFSETFVTDAALAELASLESLEELAIHDVASGAGHESLCALKRLKALHIEPYHWLIEDEGEIDRCRRALEALRQSNLGIVMDNEESPNFEEHFVWRGWRFDEGPSWLGPESSMGKGAF
jgi:hypothetical protein